MGDLHIGMMSGTPSSSVEAVRMKVRALVMDPVSNMPVVILQQEGNGPFLPIWIGVCEANSIALQIEGITTPRPMTHDLIVSLMESTEHTLQRIHIHSLRENVFYATLTLKRHDGTSVEVDSRPSDALAVALRTGAPIFVSPDVLEVAQATEGDSEDAMRAILERLRPEDLGEYEM